ncbi:MAG: response regulator transcription factor [Candidatus Sumerlaeaceae bacterium]|nr:response regulator transcription factor [Candidatus Sumerlaeaceae bacterium]
MKILLVEDETPIADFARKGLEEQGFTVDVSSDGEDGFHLATTQEYDAIILDIMLPGRDGISILKGLREKGVAVPVLLLTARGSLDDRLQGLNLGADDYMTKPFYVEELVARVHAIHRRHTGERLTIRTVGDLRINLLTREVWRGDSPIELTSREFNLLEYLTRVPGRVYTRTQILEHVWGYYFDPKTNVIDVHIQKLRVRLAREGEDREAVIQTVRGAGYRVAAAEAAAP